MKKFLSVLLALAVAFTFTFGSTMSAFAEETEAQKIDKAASEAQKTANDKIDEVVDSVVYDHGYVFYINGAAAIDDQKLVNSAALTKGVTAAKSAIAEDLAEIVRNQKLADTYTADAFDEYNNYAAADAVTAIFNTAAYVEMFGVEKAAALAKANEVKPSEYIAYDYTDDGVANSDKDKAQEALNATIKAINDVVAPKATDEVDSVIAQVKAVKAVPAVNVAGLVKTADAEKKITDAKATAKTAIEDAAKALATTLKDNYQAEVDSADTPSAKAAAQAKLNSVDTNVNTVANSYQTKLAAIVIDAKTSPTDAETAVTDVQTKAVAALAKESALNAELDKLGNIDALIAYAKNVAAAKKVEYDTDGTIKYDAAVVDEALEEAINNIKAGTITTLAGVDTAFTGMTTVKDTAAALETYKNEKKDAVDAKTESGYDEDEVAKIKDLKKAAKEAITDAATKAAVDEIMKKLDADLAALPTTAQKEALETAANTAITSLKYDTALDRLYDYTVLGTEAGAYPEAKDEILAAAKKVMVDAVLKNIDATKTIDNAAVEAVVKANYDAAKAVITGMEKVTDLEAMVAEVVKKIDAIPSTVTLADKDAVKDAAKALEELEAVPNYAKLDTKKMVAGTKKLNLENAQATVKNLEAKAVNDAIKALQDKKELTAADEAAYEAAKKLSDAYYDEYKEYAGHTTENDLAAIKTAIDAAKYNDAAKALNAIPDEVTIEDKATVEAARAAYDALTDTQKAKIAKSLVEKLEKAEAALANLTKYDNQDAKADLLDMARNLSIWKTSKNSVRVTVKGSVKNITDNGYSVKYTFYKKAPGAKAFKAVKTTTAKKYTYTKLAKGTNKYQVKVSVYDKDGKFVASKKTYYRATKVK